MKERWKKILSVSPLKIAGLLILIALLLFFFDAPFIRFMELKALDLRMVSRGVMPAGGETVIATIDEKSLSELGRWPWPRTTIAKLVDVLNEYGAKAIGFDIVFTEPDDNSSLKAVAELSREVRDVGIRDDRLSGLLEKRQKAADTDAALARSIENAKNVTLGYFFHITAKEVGHLTEQQIAAGEDQVANGRFQMVRAKKGADQSLLIRAYAAQPNLPLLSAAGENSGYFNTFPDSDGVIRWSPLVIKFRDNYYSSLALSLLVQYLDWPMLSLGLADYGVESIGLNKLMIPTDESGRLLVNYLGPAKTFTHYSISDILNRRIPGDRFKDKIVLVGATATGIYDLRVTPFASVYPGVEIHATVIDNILHQNFLIHSGWTKFLDICMIVLVGLIMGLAIPRVKAMAGIALSVSLIAAFIAGKHGDLHPVRHLDEHDLPGPHDARDLPRHHGLPLCDRRAGEEEDPRRLPVLSDGLGRQRDPEGPLQTQARRRQETSFGHVLRHPRLHVDLRKAVAGGVGQAPQRIPDGHDGYRLQVRRTSGQVHRRRHHGGLWCAAGPARPCLRACRTALEMMAKLKGLREKWAAEGRPDVNIGVGINSGDMVVGNMGSEMRFDYTVMGDSVNLASRLEGINKEYGTNIVLSEFTHEIVKDEFVCRQLDAVRVKGKKLPVRIFELLGDKQEAQRFAGFVGPFEKGLAHYREGLWDEAIAAFRSVLEIKPDDPPAKLYIDRCEALKENPPEGEWDGVFTMTKK